MAQVAVQQVAHHPLPRRAPPESAKIATISRAEGGRVHARVSPLAARLWKNMVGKLLQDNADRDDEAQGYPDTLLNNAVVLPFTYSYDPSRSLMRFIVWVYPS